MINPVLCVWFAVEGRVLDINILVARVKIDVADDGSIPGFRMFNLNTLKERWDNKIYILSRVREESHHAEGDK